MVFQILLITFIPKVFRWCLKFSRKLSLHFNGCCCFNKLLLFPWFGKTSYQTLMLLFWATSHLLFLKMKSSRFYAQLNNSACQCFHSMGFYLVPFNDFIILASSVWHCRNKWIWSKRLIFYQLQKIGKVSVLEWCYQLFKIALLGLFGGQYFHREQLLSQSITHPSSKHKNRKGIWREG